MEKLLSVQEIALKSGITAYTLRYYESLGILRPQRDKNNRRVYSDFDMEQISCITTLRKMNVPLTKIIEFHKLKFIGKSTILES